MGKRIPTLGYPSRTAAVVALREQGLKNAEIARRIGIRAEMVSVLAHEGAKRAAPAEQRTVLFPVTVIDRLAPHAKRRGLGPNELIRRLVETAVEDGMIDAILDDINESSEAA